MYVCTYVCMYIYIYTIAYKVYIHKLAQWPLQPASSGAAKKHRCAAHAHVTFPKHAWRFMGRGLGFRV